MTALHFDCFSGISGDMTVAALFDAGVDRAAVLQALQSLQLPVTVEVQSVRRGGIAATFVDVQAPPQDKHRHLSHIEKILAGGSLTDGARDLAIAIFRRLAEAEAKVHGTTPEKVHFHEVGALDSIADITMAAVAIDLLKPSHISARSVPTGSGTVHCEHGLMPVPAPATAELLKHVPLAPSAVASELTTPTGAAILTTIVRHWIDAPVMTIEKIGVGAGRKEFSEQPNVLRVFLGQTGGDAETDQVVVLETNLDDVSGEVIGFCTERLFQAGALDAYTIPMQMKKGRPGFLLGVIAPLDRVSELEEVLFRETGTLGIRKQMMQRSKMLRESINVATPWGPVKAKQGCRGAVSVVTPEYEDCARLAREKNVPLREIYNVVLKSCGASNVNG
ncbi:MAG: nickel pincer cofactor biosynthesis protein LarC [Gemmataceae bacterium]